MNFIVLPDEKLNAIIQSINEIQQTLSKIESLDLTNKKWLDSKEASDFLKVTTRSLQNYRDRGLIPFSTIGGKILFLQEDLQNFLLRHRVNAFDYRTKIINH